MSQELRRKLKEIDHRGYPAYKSLRGRYRFADYMLNIEHVQGDPFAAPSALSITITAEEAAFPKDLLTDPSNPLTHRNSIALADELLRRFASGLRRGSHQTKGSGKSGSLSCAVPGQEVLERSACFFNGKGDLTVKFLVGFPAAGRTILAGELVKILFSILPKCVSENLLYSSLPAGRLAAVRNLAEDQLSLREQMREEGLIGFIGDGAVLPRESGISQKPLKDAIPFRSPSEDRITFRLPHHGEISGMAVYPGITLIIGGGYHGKSTLLEGLERGIYDHIAGDGREFVMTDPTAMLVRAEDGRGIHNVNISPFIRNLPNGKDTVRFSSDNASGSTSQAAAVIESVEAGSRVLLMDEDTCAANFMMRDELMEQIVADNEEPIVPYCRRMRALYEELGVSTVLVAGSSGAFFREADRVIQMKDYQPYDVTEKVRALAGERDLSDGRDVSKAAADDLASLDFGSRKPVSDPKVTEPVRGRVKHKNLGRDGFVINRASADLRALEQIVDRDQMEFLAYLTIALCGQMDGKQSLQQLASRMMKRIESAGFAAAVGGTLPGNLAMVRAQDIYAVLNRCRWIL